MGEPSVRMRSIKQAQQTVSRRIAEIRKQLKEIEKLPESQTKRCWISFGRVTSVKDLAGKFPNIKDALENDLATLQAELRRIRTKAWQARTREMRQDAWDASREFQKKAERVLREAERTGSLEGESLAELRGEAEAVLEKFVDLLDRAPSDENMEAVLEHMEAPMYLGAGSEEGQSCARAWSSLGNASETLQHRAEKRFRGVPSVANLEKLLGKVVMGQMVGRGEYGGLPPEVKRSRPEHEHVVAAGQSLAEISSMFYGSPGYWDVIYLANMPEIGQDPTKVPVGITLQIP